MKQPPSIRLSLVRLAPLLCALVGLQLAACAGGTVVCASEECAAAASSDAGLRVLDGGPASSDAGPGDAGSPAGAGSGAQDAGSVAGAADAGFDAGAADAGFDAGAADGGFDASGADAGAGAADAGFDAGPSDAGAALDAGSGGEDAGSDGGLAAGADAGSTGQWVMGYYAGYSINAYPISSIDWSALTHIAFAALTVNSNGTLNTSFDDSNGTGTTDAMMLAAAAHAHGVRALLMLGGAGNGPYIAAAVSTPALLSSFVSLLLAEMDLLGYDGIDIDWEDSIDLDNLVSLAQALRAARPGMLLTYPGAMINPNYQTVDSHFVTLAVSLDRFNLQSYYPDTAYAGSGWYSWFVSPLSGESANTPIAIDDSLQRYVAAGIPKAKMGMGMAFYAICYTGGITAPRQATNGTSQVIVGGDNSYPLSKFFAAGGTYDKSTAGERLRDATAQVPYLSLSPAVSDPGCGASTQYISYDDETSIIARGTFSKSHGYGGIIVWTIQEGWLPADASGGRAQNSLMQALRTGFLVP